jgi:hypothetical protein
VTSTPLAQSAARSRRDPPVLLSLLLSAPLSEPGPERGKITLLNVREQYRYQGDHFERPVDG